MLKFRKHLALFDCASDSGRGCSCSNQATRKRRKDLRLAARLSLHAADHGDRWREVFLARCDCVYPVRLYLLLREPNGTIG